jgi:hypothetical protein
MRSLWLSFLAATEVVNREWTRINTNMPDKECLKIHLCSLRYLLLERVCEDFCRHLFHLPPSATGIL